MKGPEGTALRFTDGAPPWEDHEIRAVSIGDRIEVRQAYDAAGRTYLVILMARNLSLPRYMVIPLHVHLQMAATVDAALAGYFANVNLPNSN